MNPIPNAWYHVMNRARRGQELFPDKEDAVCNFYDVAQRELVVVRRGIQNEPRDVAIYLMRTVCGEPLMRIGNEFGMARYSSVSSAADRIKKKLLNDNEFIKSFSALMDLIKKGQSET